MAKKSSAHSDGYTLPGGTSDRPKNWHPQIDAVAYRYNREYRGETFDLPTEVESMPIFRDWATNQLAAKVASPFWELAKPKKNDRCLDIGCGISFLIYPWRDWNAYFYGHDISTEARDILTSRGPQLNSKLFKGVVAEAAHRLEYEDNQFDLAIATGVSCYYPLDYWQQVLGQVKRVLKPDGVFVFDVLDPEGALAENWAILETYLGAEVFLEDLKDWQALIKSVGAKIVKSQPSNDLFCLYKIKFVV